MVLATGASVTSSRGGDVRDAIAQSQQQQQHQQQDGHAANGSGSAYQMEGDGEVQQSEQDDEVALFFVEAVYPYRGQEANHLNFDKRDLIEVWGQDATGWWDGFLVQSTLDDHRGKRGWFPSNYVKRLPDDAGESIRRMLEAQQATAATTTSTANAADFQSSHSSPSANLNGHHYATEETTANIDSLLGVSESSVLSGASLDMLLGRRGGNFDPTDLDSVLRGSRSSGSGSLSGSKRDMADRTVVLTPATDAREADLDLTSFSAGDGDIFSEIAAAAAADHRFSSLSMSSSENGDSQENHSPPHDAAAAGSLLPPVEIADGRRETGAMSSTATANGSIDPDWIPKVSPTGRVYYYNTRTGRTAFELPSPTDASGLVSGSAEGRTHGRSDSGTAGSDGGSAPHTARGRSVPGIGSAPLLSHQSSNYEEVLDSSVTSQNDLSTLRTGGRRTNGRPDTMYSDDSALDADLSPARGGTASTLVSGSIASIDTANTGFGPRKYAVASSSQQSLVMTGGSTPESSTEEDHESIRLRLSAILAATAPPANPTIAELEKSVTEALAALSSAVQNKADYPGRGGAAGSLWSDAADRQHLEQTAASLSRASRHLLSATDVMLEQASIHSRRTSNASSIDKGPRSSLASFSMTQAVNGRKDATDVRTLPTLSGSEFRPLAMKITATESKLLLSVRTTWGLLDTSAEEEAAVEVSRSAENLTDDDISVLKKQRAMLLSARREIDAKLRYDLLVQIRTLGDHVTAFVDAIETSASRRGLSARKDALAAPRPILASFPASAASILFPPSLVAGVLRGHGWSSRAVAGVASKRSSITPSTMHFPASARESWRSSEPSRPLTSSTLESLRSSRGVLLDDLGALRTILQTLLGSQSAAVRLKPSLLPTVTTQALQLANRLARLMRDVEDVDIAGRLDVPLNLETYISLTGEDLDTVAASGIFASLSEQLASAKAGYDTALHKAASLLGELVRAKEELLGIVPNLLSVMQHLSAVAVPSPLTQQSISLPKAAAPFHPPALSPLSSFAPSAFSPSTTSSIVAALEGVESATSRPLSILTSLVALADEQAAAPAALRRPNVALRASLANALAPESALSSNAQSLARERYRRVSRPTSGVLGLEDENAEELDSASGPGQSQTVFATPGGHSGAGQRPQEAGGSQGMQRTSSTQSALLRGVVGRASRSNSVAESFASDVSKGSSYAKRDAQEDLRNAMQEAGIANNSSPTNHSPSKSKLKQFFGADAPGQTIHRPPTANRDATPTFLQPDYSHDQISYANDGSIRAGTLHALVCRMTNHMSADRAYNDAFLMTYRTFCTSQQLLDLLKQRYNLEPPAGIRADEYKLWVDQKQKLVRIRVIGALRSWITDYLYDDDDALLDQVSAFAVILPSEPSQQLARIIERRKITGAPRRLTASVSAGTAPPPIVPRNLKKIKFLDVEPLEIARQLTILDSRLFSKITVDECLSKAWPKKFNNRDMPNFRAIAKMSNAVTGWVAMTIVTQPDLRRRAAIIKHFIAIADKCRALHNFQTLMQIVAGLNSGAIYRLKRTWELVNQRSMSTLTYLGNLMSPENNHALYRDALRLVGSPCVPFLGVYFTDWVMSGEANSDMLRDKPDQINFAKRARVAESIQQIQMNQATPYNLAAVPALIKWINQELNIGAMPSVGSKEQNGYATVASSPLASLVGMASTPSPGPGSAASSVMDVTTKSPSPAVDMMTKAYDLSLRIEPRERDDERIARLLSESGFL